MAVLDDLGGVVAAEFSDLSAAEAAQLAIRLAVAGGVAGLLGWNRELAGKSAGVRTHVLVALGAVAFVAVPLQAGIDKQELSRVIQGLIAGVGFLGAGTILKSDRGERVFGLTTAAGIWLTAAVGATAGLGRETSALLLGLFGWLTLSVLGRWEARIHKSPPD